MNDYEQRQEAKRERYEELADKADRAHDAAHKRVKQISDMIPFGQPILVGHHSERHHRADVNRVERGMDKAVAEMNKAEHYRNKAAGVGRAGISSDDPEAVQKLKEKLAKLTRNQEQMKATNKAHKAYLKNPASLEAWSGPESEKQFIRTYKPTYSWTPHPYAPYQLTNNNGNIRNVKKRIADLEKAQDEPGREPIKGNGFEIVEDKEENRVKFIFDKRPERETCQIMRSNGWKWNRRLTAWTRHLNNAGRYSADNVAKQIGA